MNDQTTQEPAFKQSERQQAAPSAGSDALSDLLRQLSELFEYAAQYVSASADSVKLSARQAVIRLLIRVGVTIAMAGALVSAVTLLFVGVAGGLAEWFGREWLGNLVAGLLLLITVGATAWYCVASLKKSSHRRTAQSYEERKLRQKARFGHDATEQANASRAKN